MKFQNLKFWGVGLLALFSFNCSADWFEDLANVPKNKLHVPPSFLDHLVKPVKPFYAQESLTVDSLHHFVVMGKPHKTRELKGCRKEDGEWGFCDL